MNRVSAPGDSPVRRRRGALGLTQAELASAAGVSRQLVAAVEAGVNAPAVDAALRLARVLGCTTEELFGEGRASVPAVGGVAVGGVAVGGVAVGGASGKADAGGLVVAGCDPAVRLAEAMLAGVGSAGLIALDATTDTALAGLREGVQAAVVHGPEGRLPGAPVAVKRLRLARWQVGLGVPPGIDVTSLASCLDRGLPIVQRQETAASQQALRRAAETLGHTLPRGVIASGHMDAARAAAALRCAALTTEGAAGMFGLRFFSLELHTVQIWLDRRWEEHPGVESLGNVLVSRAFEREVGRMGGYDLIGCGSWVGDSAVRVSGDPVRSL